MTLKNIQNYGPYVTLTQTMHQIVDSSEINVSTWEQHFQSIINILRDGIEQEDVQKFCITVTFKNYPGVMTDLYIPDYLMNLIMWRGIIELDDIRPCHVFFDDAITKGTIKKFIDRFIVKPSRKKIPNIILNNLISDLLDGFKIIDTFSMYLANTIDLESDIRLMNEDPEAWEILHASMAGVPIEEVKHRGMELTNRLINKITNSEYHCLRDVFKSREGISDKQYKEYAVNIGTKPDGRGGVWPIIINNSFINGGVSDLVSYFIETAAGRIAQIISKNNVGESGHFARLLGLNNSDTILHSDPNYSCDSKNFEEIVIKNEIMLNMFANRYYRMSPNGMEMLIVPSQDKHLIGQKIYLRSPMTCASKSRGEGVCYRCYGDLAYTNNDINIGKIAAEILSAILTQILLSAKHLLESRVKKLEWPKWFNDFLQIEANVVFLQEELVQFSGLKMVIDPSEIGLESESDDFEYNEYITSFDIVDKAGKIHPIFTNNSDNMYITEELNHIIRHNAHPKDGKVVIDLKDLEDVPLFLIKLKNNELSATLDELQNIINKNSETAKYDRNTILQAFIEKVIEGQLNISAIHCEIIISNQLRSADDILLEPQWEYPNATYQVLTLNKALTNHPSVVVAMSYERLTKMLYNPLTFRKNKPAFMDLFFNPKPQVYLKQEPEDAIEFN